MIYLVVSCFALSRSQSWQPALCAKWSWFFGACIIAGRSISSYLEPFAALPIVFLRSLVPLLPVSSPSVRASASRNFGVPSGMDVDNGLGAYRLAVVLAYVFCRVLLVLKRGLVISMLLLF